MPRDRRHYDDSAWLSSSPDTSGGDTRVNPRLKTLALLLTGLLALARPADAQTTSRYVYDAAGRLVLVLQADGTLVTYDYDAAGNLLKVDVQRPTNTDGEITAIHPSAMIPASEGIVSVFGVRLEAANAVSFDSPGITATIQGAPASTTLSLLVRVDATVAPGAYPFTVHRTSLPSIASGAVVLNVRPVPTLVAVAPARVLTGQTIESFTLTGARLDRTPNVVFSRPGLTLSGVTASADGTSLTGRLQVSLTMAAGPVDVSVSTSEGKSRSVVLRVDRSVPGLTGSYFANTFALDASGLPVVPATFPTFIRGDAALQYGTSTGFQFRPCFIGSAHCLTGSYTVRWQGYIFLQEAGSYAFALNSSDASQLRINGNPVVSNPGTHARVRRPTAHSWRRSPAAILSSSRSTRTATTPGIDLLYQPPGAPSLSPVPAGILWGDGGVSDPLLTSAVAAVSVSNPATPASPEGTSPVASARAAVSFVNPAPISLPGAAAPVAATGAVVSFLNPAAVLEPGTTQSNWCGRRGREFCESDRSSGTRRDHPCRRGHSGRELCESWRGF